MLLIGPCTDCHSNSGQKCQILSHELRIIILILLRHRISFLRFMVKNGGAGQFLPKKFIPRQFIPRQFIPRTVHTQNSSYRDSSYPGTIHTLRQFIPRTVHTLKIHLQVWIFWVWTVSGDELSQGMNCPRVWIVPGMNCLRVWTVPGYELSQGMNWPTYWSL